MLSEFKKEVKMHTGFHIAISAALGALVYFFTGNVAAAWALLLGGVLIDLDHLIDSLFIYKRIDVKRIKDVKTFSLHEEKIILGLHSVELLILILAFNFNTVTFGFCAGMFSHMLMDFFYYKPKGRQKSLWSLFFVYRWRKKFSAKLLCA